MKRIISLAALVAVGVAIGLFLRGYPVRQAAGGPPLAASQNGDVNGDGFFDIADPVAMLLYLFAEGQEPVACAGGVPTDTTELVMAVERIEALLEQKCEDRRDRFVDNGDDTVTDTCLGIMWSRTTLDTDGNGSVSDGSADRVTHEDAVVFVDELQLAGHDNWRLPTVWEWDSLLRMENAQGIPEVDLFAGNSNYYWASDVRTLDGWVWRVFIDPNGEPLFSPGQPSLTLFAVAVRDITE